MPARQLEREDLRATRFVRRALVRCAGLVGLAGLALCPPAFGGFEHISSWETDPADHISAIAVGPGGDVYLSDSNHDRILRVDPDGQILGQWGAFGINPGEFRYPIDIATGVDSVYVLDYYNRRVQRFTTGGQYLNQWGGTGTLGGLFDYPSSIATDGHDVLTLDVPPPAGDRVQRFSSHGEFLGFFEVRPDSIQVAADTVGNTFVANFTGARKLHAYDEAGNHVAAWGPYGFGDGQFAPEPTEVVVDADNHVIVSDNSERLQVFTGRGGFIESWDGSEVFSGNGIGHFIAMAPGPGGLVYVAHPPADEILVLHYTPEPATRVRHPQVVEVLDGDTLVVKVGRKRLQVHPLGTDAPEIDDGLGIPGRRIEGCGALRAKRALQHLVSSGDRARLDRDRVFEQEERQGYRADGLDRDGHLLRYVEVGGVDLGLRQVARGWARIYTFGTRFERLAKYRRAQELAKRKQRGLWGICSGRFDGSARSLRAAGAVR